MNDLSVWQYSCFCFTRHA
uniref:Uncharacterized protein n=1 Tax=Anguilla anguilla TaxID=7936 RepID=A0A0E9RSS8_ANGAN